MIPSKAPTETTCCPAAAAMILLKVMAEMTSLKAVQETIPWWEERVMTWFPMSPTKMMLTVPV